METIEELVKRGIL
jgi:transposase InsO family protein